MVFIKMKKQRIIPFKIIISWTIGYILGALTIGGINWTNLIKDIMANLL